MNYRIFKLGIAIGNFVDREGFILLFLFRIAFFDVQFL